MDLWSLTKTTRTETCLDNRWGYNVRRAAACPYRADGSQGDVGVGSRYQINGRGGESTRFHGKIRGELRERADGVRWVVSVGLATVSDVVLMVVVGWGLEANEPPWA